MTEAPADTKERILDAAEKLFAEQGFSGTSLRAITSAAGVNLAAVNYHFGSKEALIAEAFRRRIEPINVERFARLDRIEASPDGGTVEDVLEAFLAPPLYGSRDPRTGEGLTYAAQMIGHATSRPDTAIRDLLFRQFENVVQRFTEALGRRLPGLPEEELLWRFLFLVGTMAHTMAISGDVERLSEGRCGAHDVEGLIRSMIAFNAAGFRAAATVTKEP